LSCPFCTPSPQWPFPGRARAPSLWIVCWAWICCSFLCGARLAGTCGYRSNCDVESARPKRFAPNRRRRDREATLRTFRVTCPESTATPRRLKMSPPVQRIIDLSTIFCNSRMLPGQAWSWHSSNVRFSILWICFAIFSANFLTKYSINRGMSSLRFRKGGTWVGKTFNL